MSILNRIDANFRMGQSSRETPARLPKADKPQAGKM
jgi:hypothetical protein